MKPSIRGTPQGVLWAAVLLASFITFMFLVLFSYREEDLSGIALLFVEYHMYAMLLLGTLGIAVGAAVFYLMSPRVEDTQRVAKVNAEVVLRFLTADERLVVRKLIEERGKALQVEVSRLAGMNKVKAHRTLNKLAEKDVVTLERHGKTKLVRLKPEIYSALS